MNLPNKLTVVRILLVPVYILFMLADAIPANYLIAMLIFIGASITDAVDGHIARKNNLVTDFGKFMDPLADKILVAAALICFLELGYSGAVPVIIIISREFVVSAVRIAALSSSGSVISAGMLGKIKTACSMVSFIAVMLWLSINEIVPFFTDYIPIVSNILMWICAGLTLISGIQYIVLNKDKILPEK